MTGSTSCSICCKALRRGHKDTGICSVCTRKGACDGKWNRCPKCSKLVQIPWWPAGEECIRCSIGKENMDQAEYRSMYYARKKQILKPPQ